MYDGNIRIPKHAVTVIIVTVVFISARVVFVEIFPDVCSLLLFLVLAVNSTGVNWFLVSVLRLATFTCCRRTVINILR